MPNITTFIEDTSPLLRFNGNWAAGNSSNDILISMFSEASYTVTTTQGSSMSFSFYGSSVSIIGTRRFNHGTYHVQLDDRIYPQTSALFNDAPLVNQVLFTADVDLGSHEVTITSDDINGIYLDVDYVSYVTSIGQPSESLIVNTYHDSHPSFTYGPPSSWGPALMPSISGSTGHATSDLSATVTFKFEVSNHDALSSTLGTAVGLYGPVGPNITSSFSVQVDDRPVSYFNAKKGFNRRNQLLFYAGNLSNGPHTLIAQTKSDSGLFAIDHANVYTTESLGGSFASTCSVKAQTSDSGTVQPSVFPVFPRDLPHGVVAGLVISCSIAFISTAALIWLCLRHRRELHRFNRSEGESKGLPYAHVRPFLLPPGPPELLAGSKTSSIPTPGPSNLAEQIDTSAQDAALPALNNSSTQSLIQHQSPLAARGKSSGRAWSIPNLTEHNLIDATASSVWSGGTRPPQYTVQEPDA